MDILITVKNVYGNEMVYPACDTARKFADLLNTKTLTPRALEIIKSLGYTVRTVVRMSTYSTEWQKDGIVWREVKSS
jgi:hypothetical protein